MIAEEENGMGINTTQLDENNKNPIKTNGLNRSEQDKIYTGRTTSNAANGITVTQTYYCLNSSSTGLSDNLANAYSDNVYYQLFHGSVDDPYWLASRCSPASPDYCAFDVFYAAPDGVSASGLFGSNNTVGGCPDRFRPVVSDRKSVV